MHVGHARKLAALSAHAAPRRCALCRGRRASHPAVRDLVPAAVRKNKRTSASKRLYLGPPAPASLAREEAEAPPAPPASAAAPPPRAPARPCRLPSLVAWLISLSTASRTCAAQQAQDSGGAARAQDSGGAARALRGLRPAAHQSAAPPGAAQRLLGVERPRSTRERGAWVQDCAGAGAAAAAGVPSRGPACALAARRASRQAPQRHPHCSKREAALSAIPNVAR